MSLGDGIFDYLHPVIPVLSALSLFYHHFFPYPRQIPFSLFVGECRVEARRYQTGVKTESARNSTMATQQSVILVMLPPRQANVGKIVSSEEMTFPNGVTR